MLFFLRGTLSAAITSSTTGRVRVLMVGLAAALCDPARDPIADAQRGCESEQPDIVGSGRQCVESRACAVNVAHSSISAAMRQIMGWLIEPFLHG